MGKVQFRCQNCQTERELDERWLGLQTVCLGCGKPVTVQPIKENLAPPVADTPLPLADEQDGPTSTAADDAGASASPAGENPLRLRTTNVKKIHFNCPDCGRGYAFNESSVGVTVKCYRCGVRILIVNADGEIEKLAESESDGKEKEPRDPQTVTEWLRTPLSQLGPAIKRRHATSKLPSEPLPEDAEVDEPGDDDAPASDDSPDT